MSDSIHIQKGSVPPTTMPSPVFPGRFVVVGYDIYYPGYFDDQILSKHSTEQEAEEALAARTGSYGEDRRYDTMHVVDLLAEAMSE